jgi:hypothetical protein
MNSTAQDPDWKFFKDREGNKYFIDRNGKIWTAGRPEFLYKPVSHQGIDYYLRQGIELIDNRYRVEGLTILKSILALPPDNSRITRAQNEAVKKINYLKKNDGDRFITLNESANILLVKDQKSVKVINDWMYYSLDIPADVTIIKNTKRGKLGYNYNGLLIGIRIEGGVEEKKKEGMKFDFLLAVGSEKFHGDLKNIDELENKWRMTLWEDVFKRKILEKNEGRLIYQFSTKDNPRYSGFEGLYANRNYGYMVRIITTELIFEKHSELMKDIINKFSHVVIK